MIGIAPHPPIIIPEIGRSEITKARKTVDGMYRLGKIFNELNPELIIIITPHGQIMREGPAVLTGKKLQGHFGHFGFPGIHVEFETDMKLLELLRENADRAPLRPIFLEDSDRFYEGNILDHGAMVPLYFLREAGVNAPGLHITFGFNSFRDLYKFGTFLRKLIEERGKRVAVLASGDLSHRLIPGAPAGYDKRGAKYDQRLVELLRSKEIDQIVNFDPDLVEAAGECGLRSFLIALGMLHGEVFNSEIISYEGPFGVGYLVAALIPSEISSDSDRKEVEQPAVQNEKETLNPARFARMVLKEYLADGIIPQLPAVLPDEYKVKSGVFVSLKKEGQLRGCIGTVEPVRENLASEIIANAISAALRDPRFSPVCREELADLVISVDVLSPMERIKSISELNPKKYGVLVRSGMKTGLLLPDLEGIDSAEDQVDIARRKAGITRDEPVELYRFTVTRYKE
ncbi:MAG: AmmeMemoRadiSam system protein A [Bacillota bacterium]|nr:AmmeMemoRadiSam system protein A [Bacillota bacterium]